MIEGMLIGFSIGLLFSFLIAGVTRSIACYFRFRVSGRLIELGAVEQKFGSDITFYVFSDLVIFNVILLPGNLARDESAFPWMVLSNGYMLSKARTRVALLQKRYPNAEVKKVFLPPFG